MTSNSIPTLFDSHQLEQALQEAGPGSVLRLAPGVYREPLLIERSGEPGRPLRVEAEVPGSVIFSGARSVTGWTREETGRWSIPFTHDLPQALESHFGYITLPVQVWVEDRRLTLVAGPEELTTDSFCTDGETLWICVEESLDPNVVAVEVTDRAEMLRVSGAYVEIRGIVVTRCGVSVQQGGATFTGAHGVVEDCEFSEAAGGIGAHFDGHDARIRRNRIHHNGQMGFGLVASRVRFEENDVHDNDLRGFCGHPDAEWHVWECGGGKVAYSIDSVFRRNRFVDNLSGPGLWLDIDNYRNRIEENLFINNGHSAIMIEISRDNVICNNIICDSRESNYSAAAILVQLSVRTRIYHNLIYCSEGFGVHLRWHVRNRDIHPFDPADPEEFEARHGFKQTDWMPPDGQYPVAENDIRNNVFVDCRRGAIQLDAHPEHTRDNHSDYNLFLNRHNLHPMAGGHRLLEWQELTGLDAHSFYERDMVKENLFVREAERDFHPHPDGPLAGIRVPRIGEVSVDWDGTERKVQVTPGPFES